jgi:hypothetical protein
MYLNIYFTFVPDPISRTVIEDSMSQNYAAVFESRDLVDGGDPVTVEMILQRFTKQRILEWNRESTNGNVGLYLNDNLDYSFLATNSDFVTGKYHYDPHVLTLVLEPD